MMLTILFLVLCFVGIIIAPFLFIGIIIAPFLMEWDNNDEDEDDDGDDYSPISFYMLND